MLRIANQRQQEEREKEKAKQKEANLTERFGTTMKKIMHDKEADPEVPSYTNRDFWEKAINEGLIPECTVVTTEAEWLRWNMNEENKYDGMILVKGWYNGYTSNA